MLCRKGVVWGTKITEKVVWQVVKEYAQKLGVSKLAPHDLKKSCARFCHHRAANWSKSNFCSVMYL
jgi:hypothetical protein